MQEALIGVLGGSGLYHMEALTEVREHTVATPYGAPSDVIMTGALGGARVAFLARHGRGHRLIPGEVPYRANIYALKSLGVRYLISVSAVGSLREDIRPLDIVLPDQLIDMTRGRISTFFGDGAVAHVSLAEPVCRNLTDVLTRSINANLPAELRLHTRGAYVCIEGPAFSTQAESHWYRSMGAHVIGMTAMPEARLAREAQLAYAMLALVTDYDCWHPTEAHVTADLALKNLLANAARAQTLLASVITRLAQEQPTSAAHTALAGALVTPIDAMTPAVKERLRALLP